MVLTPAEYTTVNATAYNRPTHPGPLVIAPGTAQHEATRLRTEHKEAIRLFRETIDVEKALIKQIVAAVEPKYLKSLRDTNSNAINVPVHAVLTHLFNKYGEVNADTLMDIEDKTKAMEYNLVDPLIVVFNEIEELARLGTAADNPFSDKQLVQIGLKIIKNTNDFENAINAWYERPALEHTWDNFKNHFDEAREVLKKVRGSDMRNTAFQQVTFIANEVRADIERTRDSIIEALAEREVEDPTSEPANEVANASISDQTQLAILQLLKDIREDLKRAPNTPKNPRRKLYCWSHGACGHKSSDCRNKKDGHQDNATFTDKKDGSTKGCTTA